MATFALTALAMLAFAGNSILCRLALGSGLIDAASFTTIRATSGAIMLLLICFARGKHGWPKRTNWRAATMLFVYMACFSFAYLSLSAGTGALILFGAVQMTMIIYALRNGETLSLLSWAGFALAAAGLVWLVFPGLAAPDPVGAVLMGAAGVAWGIYSLLGRGGSEPAVNTTRNFVLAAPMTLVLTLLMLQSATFDWRGIALAIGSGAITSGLGYVIWYAVLPKLTAARAASVQLTVPVIAAALGVALLSESMSTRLVLASVAILGGVGIVGAQRNRV